MQLNTNEIAADLLSLPVGTPLRVTFTSFGHTRSCVLRVKRTLDRSHVWGDSYPRVQTVYLSDGTQLRQSDGLTGRKVSRWRGSAPLADITAIELLAVEAA